MTLTIENDAVPIRIDDDGNAVVGKTRVRLILVVSAFEQGCSPEEIIERYTSLELADVYAVIGYYLRHRDEVSAYMCEREKQADESTCLACRTNPFPTNGWISGQIYLRRMQCIVHHAARQ